MVSQVYAEQDTVDPRPYISISAPGAISWTDAVGSGTDARQDAFDVMSTMQKEEEDHKKRRKNELARKTQTTTLLRALELVLAAAAETYTIRHLNWSASTEETFEDEGRHVPRQALVICR